MSQNKKSIAVLGINYGGHDTSAALMIDGKMIAACEQERFTLDKHSRKFPIDAINECLKIGKITLDEIDEVGLVYDGLHQVTETYLKPALDDPDRVRVIIEDIDRIDFAINMEREVRKLLGYKGPIKQHRHHMTHAAGAYYPSGFSEALIVSVDGMGEIATSLVAGGKDGEITELTEENRYPNSLGLFYSAITYYLGYQHHYDEGIIMGLASWGDETKKIPGSSMTYYEAFCEIIEETGTYNYRINTDWISYHKQRDTWISQKFLDLFGPIRKYEDEMTEHHMDLAAGLQKRLEVVMINQLKAARKEFGYSKLCLTGGVSLNCSMNGKIEAERIFDEIYVQPASGDNGCAIGACYLSYIGLHGKILPKRDHNSYTGSRFTDDEIVAAIKEAGLEPKKSDDIFSLTAQKLKEGKIVGWFQGAAEFGPRALGNRSILCKPFPTDMKDYINAQIKFREHFRPFAPSALAEHAQEYFEINQESPHMLIACQVKKSMEDKVGAIVHVDGSCRLQTVTPQDNERYYKLINTFYKMTDCPVVLNTSFNIKGQPIVNTPAQALKNYLTTKLDFVALGDYYFEKDE
ncbi:carbamoyl transferase [Candidatus Woesearchaeota archaeon]|nr:carbamoyl transferase [Candidatus Woesearchaeota archaeon]